MATLTGIWRDVVPTAAWLSPAGAGARGEPTPEPEIGWVRVLRARVPALEGLEPGNLAIVPEPVLDALAAGAADPAAVVEELARAGVPALLLVGDGSPGSSVARLLDAARARRLPVLRVASADPWALERSIVGYLVNRRAELDRQAAQVDATVERLALGGHGLESLAGAIGGFLGRAVAIEDERGSAVALHAPDGVSDAAAAVARYLAQPRHAALRVPLPGEGFLVLLGAQSPGDLDRTVAERVAPIVALEMGRERALRRARDAGRGPDALPAGGPPWVVIVARQIVPGEEASAEERARRRERIARLAPPRRLLLRGDLTSLEYRLVAATAADDARGSGIAARVASTIGRPVAVSRPFARPEDRSAAEAEARATLEAIEAVDRARGGAEMPADTGGQPRVVVAERVAAYRLIGELHNLPNGTRLAAALLAPILEGRPAARRQRLETLRAVLEHPGTAAAAEALGVHRNTLLYRLARIESRTGWRLDDPDLRLALGVAVRIVQNAQEADDRSA